MKTREGYYPEQNRDQSLKDTLPGLGKLQQEVYEVILCCGKCTTEQIAEILGRYIHSITTRVFELRDLGLVKYAGNTISEKTRRKVSLWEIDQKQLTLF